MTTMNVLDAAGSTVAVEKPLTPGQAAMAASRPVVLASDQSSIPVAATLAAETTKVIGTVRTASGGIASGSVAAGALAAGSGVDGWDLTQGAIADAAVTAGATGSISAKLRSISRDLIGGIILQAGANVIGAVTQSGSWVLSAGAAIIGKVGIDQTTNGTTNKVAADLRVAGTAVDLGVGTGGSATPRMAIDSSQVAQTAVLTAAAAPASGLATLGQYNATNPAPTDTQTVALQLDPNGKLLVQPYGNPANFVSGAITTAMTGTTTTSLVAAPAAGLRNYLTTIIVSNAHATVGTDIIIQDGSGGTTLLTIPAAAVYGGAVITLPTPLRQPTTATAIFCANVTTGASTKVSAVGYKGL